MTDTHSVEDVDSEEWQPANQKHSYIPTHTDITRILLRKKVKVKFSHTRYWEFGPALIPVTGSHPAGNFLSHPRRQAAITFRQACGHLPSGRTSPAFDRTKLYCFVTEAHMCEQLAQGCYAAFSRWESNPRSKRSQSNALPLSHFATRYVYKNQL